MSELDQSNSNFTQILLRKKTHQGLNHALFNAHTVAKTPGFSEMQQTKHYLELNFPKDITKN